ncbi:alpha/beta hydrolase fold protein [Leadbetterella byssophila DSM 17132]|uniref:Alpha/beta hydrolase fold protein n=1 Tax=Leadbetterella byssophila (strain DSM 17132 / JCM 16389 / KACC 11308 / NBRC 106382 / 4M15) TaxID=649349 RepID=E4RQT6_LEAB4|nr:alpha/beta hydrolase [Leadbetterella byssophila]ADQ17542.1 alpha/beta hydrolase fold protein [Leadbetterella byssophila DSM 17132]
MKKLLFLLCVLSPSVFAQSVIGSWSGELSFQGVKLPLIIHIKPAGDGITATMDSPYQGAKDLPVQVAKWADELLTIEVTNIGLSYKAKLVTPDSLHGDFSQGPLKVKFGMSRSKGEKPLVRPQTPEGPYAYYTEEVTVKNEVEGNVLAGTLAAPDQSTKHPILVMITGSGAQTRDEELFGHKPFLVIADHLAKQGIATLRLDDRGMGQSEAGKPDATSADYAGDILSAVNFLSKRGYKNIGLLGHSEGGMIAPMVNSSKVKFMVLLAAPGIPIVELMRAQTYEIGRSQGAPEAMAKRISDTNYKLYQYMNSYKGSDFRADVLKYLKEEMKDPQAETTIKQVESEWFRYFIAFDPTSYLKKVKVPVLALNGTKDVQVTAKENLEGLRASLPKNKKTEILAMEGLNHLFQTAKTGSVMEYGQIEETISPAVLEKIASWIKSL